MKAMKRLCWLILAAVLAAAPALAQERARPGDWDYLVLSLSWSPSWCASKEGRGDREQCGGPRRFGFIVHGLWPQREAGYPANCATNDSQVPREVVEATLPIMPSRKLIEHEWDKHGTCFGGGVRAYFDRTRAAFDRVRLPEPFREPARPQALTVAEVERLFMTANPGLGRDGVAVVCRGGKAAELRLCMDKELNFRSCGRDVRDRCKGEAVFPAVR